MAGKKSGTIQKVVIGGVTVDAAADLDFTKKVNIEKEAQATTGETNFKNTLVNPDIEAIKLSMTPLQNERIEKITQNGEQVDCSIITADGSTYRAKCELNHNGYTSGDGVAEVDMLPVNARRGWALFAPA